jgi:hypothetical protein
VNALVGFRLIIRIVIAVALSAAGGWVWSEEEPPFFRSRHMGSRTYARSLKERGEHIDAMLCLESVGYYSQEPGSQSFPFPVFWLRRSPGDTGRATVIG